MALRKEDLYEAPEAVVLDFPVRIARARAARARRARLERKLASWTVALGLSAAVITGTALAGSPTVASRTAAPQTVVVEAGETLFDIASRYAAEGSDLEAYAAEMAELNGVQGVAPPGTELRLP